MNIKVNKARLIAAITAKRDAAVQEHLTAVNSATTKFSTYKEELRTRLAELTAAVKSAKVVGDLDGFMRYGSLRELPTPPQAVAKSPNTTKWDDALTKLSLVDDETVTLTDRQDADFLSLI